MLNKRGKKITVAKLTRTQVELGCQRAAWPTGRLDCIELQCQLRIQEDANHCIYRQVVYLLLSIF